MKILIISHNPMTTYHNMGKTLLSLFSGFDRRELCQLYIYPSIPDVEKCNAYFQITDKEVLQSYYKFSVKGREVFPDVDRHKEFIDTNDEKLYRNPKNKKASRALARDMMWKCARWYNKALKTWLDKENPTCIFVAPGDAKFVYDIALKIAKKRKLPIVSYICDEYYFVEKPKGFLAGIRQKLLSRKIEKFYKKVNHAITICEELNRLYSDKFGISATTVMTASSYPIADNIKFCQSPQAITFMGNLGWGRYRALEDIACALESLNKAKGTEYKLRIYSAETEESVLSVFNRFSSVEFCGYVSGEEFKRVFYSSDILLHAEAFDGESIELTKHSISTKIGDSLGSGICLFAYGAETIASIQHLQRNDCAVICTNPTELENALWKVFTDTTLRERVQKKALDTAQNCHSRTKQGELVRAVFESLSTK